MSILTTIWKVLTLKCEESTQLVSESLDRKLTWSDRLAVKAHALSCRSCRRFRQQILFLREAARRLRFELTTSLSAPGSSLTPKARERIKEAIIRQMR